ncbi:helix-turn-helix domain-containing protein [Aestuariivita sp.]|jgi:AcrR family transcriptional regulator|uniref:TetR/AcrR family transcriptional regulator n=1 Tax=Aestuariivita sp. TaxID=1872407 RepID=UPI00216C8471|nr:helix-turn-helix domain-containing protein [Aestuariivita sp.]MCE8009552.1 helix-turn-helix transcriptional regulator [Aestuariivita sp.]
MTRNNAPQKNAPADPAEERLKASAQRLFSKRGIDGVSVRDIVAEAGLRNGASLHYYFRSKDGLIRALVLDGANRSDTARRKALDALEARGETITVRDIIKMLVDVETLPQGEESAPSGFGHMRFIVALQINHRRLMDEALDGHSNIGYRRSLDHMRACLPGLPADILNQRFIFMYINLVTILAAREAAFEAHPEGGKLWSSPEALPNLVATLAAAIEAPWPLVFDPKV